MLFLRHFFSMIAIMKYSFLLLFKSIIICPIVKAITANSFS